MAAGAKEEIKNILKAAKVSDLPRVSSVVEFSSKSSLVDSFEKLINAKVLSGPVYDEDKKEYVGFLDLRDLVSYVIHGEKAKDQRKHYNLKDIVSYVPQVANADVSITYLARRNRFQPVKEEDTLLDLAEILRSRIHRVPVLNEEGKIVNIISQSVIIGYINGHLEKIPALGNIPISEFEGGTSPVSQVTAQTTTLTAFEMLDNLGRFGIAVTGEGGAIVTQTSVTDLKLWLKNPTSDLLTLPIMRFLQSIRMEDIDIQVPVLACTGKDTVAHVMQRLQATRQHRIYVVDAQYRPQKVVSLTDILKWID